MKNPDRAHAAWLKEYESLWADDATRVYIIMTPQMAKALTKGKVPRLVREQAARVVAMAEETE